MQSRLLLPHYDLINVSTFLKCLILHKHFHKFYLQGHMMYLGFKINIEKNILVCMYIISIETCFITIITPCVSPDWSFIRGHSGKHRVCFAIFFSFILVTFNFVPKLPCSILKSNKMKF